SAGWDPGLFSIMRCLMTSVIPDCRINTFWGRGVSQGHSDAIRHIGGVKNAVQYTVPKDGAMELARSGYDKELTTRQKHLRECYVVAEAGANLAEIENNIKNMPDYFRDYDTTVTFITEQQLKENHSTMPHAGSVISTGTVGGNHNMMEFNLDLESNAVFTASVLVCYARAATRLALEGVYGAKTVYDIPLSYLHLKNRDTLIKELM
ncbi:MAG: diaminopimelate dehydrogenase, partial [Oscillospiraceae bacterium]|nr:diaminopimelate dehydrogenase [Oscillospiraceae bacterium]